MATYTRRINLYINGKEVKNDIKSIQAEMNKLRRTVKNSEIGSKEYNAAMRQIKQLNPILRQHNAELRNTNQNLLSMKGAMNTLNKFKTAIFGAVGAMTGIAYGTSRAVKSFAEFDERVADVMKTTQLSRNEVLALNEAFKQMNTRTAQNTLMELAYVAGKLGITAQEDIIGFVNAADKISVTLAKDLGGNAEEAIRAIGKAVNIFKLEEIYGIEDAMLRVGSAINDLGMASVAQEGFLVEFVERVAGVAPLADVSIQNILGLAATLDQFGQRSEVSSTAYIKLMTTMATESEQMARITGMSIKEWTNLFARDANEAMLLFLESLGNNEGAFNSLVKNLQDSGTDGQRMTAVMGTLVNNVETLRKQQDLANKSFADGTSINEEFNIKNTNAQAILDKKRKVMENIRVEMGSRLFPAYLKGMNTIEGFSKVVATLIEFLMDHSRVVITLVAGITAYHIAVKVMTGAQVAWSAVANTARFTMLKMQLGYYRLIGATEAATAAQAKLNLVTMSNPWLAVAGAVMAVVTALLVFAKTKKQVSALDQAHINIQKQSAEEYNNTAATVERLTRIIEDERLSNEKRKDAIDELKRVMPEYNGLLNQEGVLIGHNVDKIKDWLDVQRQKIRAKILEQEVQETLIKQYELEDKIEESRFYLEQARRKMRESPNDPAAKARLGMAQKEYDNLLAQHKDYTDALLELDEKRMKEQPVKERDRILAEINAIEAGLKRLTEGNFEIKLEGGSMLEGAFIGTDFVDRFDEESINGIKTRLEGLYATLKELNKATADTPTPLGNFTDAAESEALKNLLSQRSRELQLINQRMQQGITDTNELYQGIRFKTEEEYQRAVLKTEISYAQGRLAAADAEAENLLDLKRDLAEKLLRQAAEENKRLAGIRKDGMIPLDEEVMAYHQRLIDLGLFFDMERELTEDELKALEKLHREHLEKLDKLNADMFDQELDEQTKAFERRMTALQFQQAKEFAAIKTEEEARAYLRQYMNEEEIAQLKTFYDLQNAVRKQQEGVVRKEQMQFFEQMITDLNRMMESMEFDTFDPMSPESFLSDETKEVILARLREIIAEYVKLLELLNKQDGQGGPSAPKSSIPKQRVDVFGFSPDDWEVFFDNIKKSELKGEELYDTLAMGAAGIANAWYDTNQVITNMENRQLEAFKRSNEAKQRSLEGMLKSGLISQESFEAQKTKLAEQLDRKQAIFARRQARREKAQSMFGAIVNTALAVTKALPNVLLAALIAAAGAVQVGIIASTPLPQIPGAEEGGQMMKVVRQQDGRPFNAKYDPARRGWINKPTIITGENGAREYVIPEEGARNPNIRPFIDMIERARLNGSLPTLNPMANASTRIPGREQGGYLSQQTSSVKPSTTPAVYHDERTNVLLEQNALILAELNKQIRLGIRAEVALTGRKGLIESQEEYDQLMANANL